MKEKLIIAMLIIASPALADTFEKVSDTEVKRITEVVEDVNSVIARCDKLRSDRNSIDEYCNRTLKEYDANIDNCDNDLRSIENAGIEVNSEAAVQ